MKRIEIPSMSYSSLSLYNECPRKFYFNKILKLPYPSSKSSRIGSAVHWLLHRYYSKEDIAPDQEYSDEIMKIAQKLIQKYISKYKYLDDFKVFQNALEKNFSFKRKGINWNGIIDMIIIKKDGKKFIVDHKYTSRRFKESFVALTFQGALYYYYLEYIADIKVDGIIWNTIYSPSKLLRSGEPSSTVDFVRYKTDRSEVEIENMWKVIDKTMFEIENSNFLPHISRTVCEYCPYIEQCIAMQKGFKF